jgi:hypothetical protein
MKRFLVIALIYTLNILMFLFAKSAGASRPEMDPEKSLNQVMNCSSIQRISDYVSEE